MVQRLSGAHAQAAGQDNMLAGLELHGQCDVGDIVVVGCQLCWVASNKGGVTRLQALLVQEILSTVKVGPALLQQEVARGREEKGGKQDRCELGVNSRGKGCAATCLLLDTCCV